MPLYAALALTAILLITPIAVLVIVSRRRDAGHNETNQLADCERPLATGRG